MTLQTRALLAAVGAGLFVVAASYGTTLLFGKTAAGNPPPSSHSAPNGQDTSGGAPSAASAPPPTANDIAEGSALYTNSCVSCHGEGGQGGFAPNLRNPNLTAERIARRVKNGSPGKMPAFGNQYSASQQQAIVAYVQSLN
jgi:mono/diheme cytochrome c family protein